MNITIMRAFVEMRRLAMEQNDLKLHFDKNRERLGKHDALLNAIYDALEIFWMKKQSSANGRIGRGFGGRDG